MPIQDKIKNNNNSEQNSVVKKKDLLTNMELSFINTKYKTDFVTKKNRIIKGVSWN